MKVFSDSLSVLSDNWILVLTILFIILTGQMLIHLSLKRIFGKELTAEEYFSLGIGGWLLPALLISLLWLVWGIMATQPPEVLIVFILIFTVAYSAILFFSIRKESILRFENNIICSVRDFGAQSLFTAGVRFGSNPAFVL